eukprot:EG_transcript_3003
MALPKGGKPGPSPQPYHCDICACTMDAMEDWKSHLQGKRHQTNLLFNPTWRDPYGCAHRDPRQESAQAAKRAQLEPIQRYCEHFRALILAENKVEQGALMERINSWPRWTLEEKGFAYFDMVAERLPGPKAGVVFRRQDEAPLPFSIDLAATQLVFVTPSATPLVVPTNKKVTAKGEVVAIGQGHLEVRGLPNPLPDSASGTYRIDLALSEATTERMLQSLEMLITAFATATESGTGQGSFGLGVLAPQSPVSRHVFADILGSQARARSHVDSIFSTALPVNWELSALCRRPAAGLSQLLRSPTQSAEVNGGRRLDLVAQRLNASQQAAVRRVIQDRAQLTLIQGPPGTGKTTTAVAIICEWLLRYRGKILVTAYSNQGVNNLMAGLAAHGIRVIRVGKPDATRSEFHVDKMIEQNPLEQQRRRLSWEVEDVRRKISRATKRPPADLMVHLRDLSRQLGQLSSGAIVAQSLEQAEVVCTTCVGAGLGMLRAMAFPLVLLDEATQAPEPATLIPFFHGSMQVVMVGDQCQLPPTVQSEVAAKGGLDISLFDRLISDGVETHVLDTQYRMHPVISAFPAQRFYQGRLRDGVAEADRTLPQRLEGALGGESLCILNVEGMDFPQGTSQANLQEAACVATLVGRLAGAGVELENVGVITPYAAHVALISTQVRDLLGTVDDLDISSVDGFQGQEKDVIILSMCRANDQQAVGFASDWRRMNVSLTRARFLLFVVCHVETLCGDALWRDFFAFHQQRLYQWDPRMQDAMPLHPHIECWLAQRAAPEGEARSPPAGKPPRGRPQLRRRLMVLPRNSTVPLLASGPTFPLPNSFSAPPSPLYHPGPQPPSPSAAVHRPKLGPTPAPFGPWQPT